MTQESRGTGGVIDRGNGRVVIEAKAEVGGGQFCIEEMRIAAEVGEETLHHRWDQLLVRIDNFPEERGLFRHRPEGIWIFPGSGGAPFRVATDDRFVQRTGDRWYREIINADTGSTEVTQFVGGIPPGRAPDHFHLYEEVIVILEGTGTMWAGASHTAIEPGSCIFLPHGQVHCVENRGDGEMRLLGVFYPAGSPAVRYGVREER